MMDVWTLSVAPNFNKVARTFKRLSILSMNVALLTLSDLLRPTSPRCHHRHLLNVDLSVEEA